MALSTQRSETDENPRHLSLAELDQSLRSVDPAVLLVQSRILRRVIKQTCGIGGLGLRVPHRKTFIIDRSRLLSIVEPNELPPGVADPPPHVTPQEILLLLPQPNVEWLRQYSDQQVWSKYWRLLFHVRVHQALNDAVALGRLTPAIVAQRIAQLGKCEFAEGARCWPTKTCCCRR